MPRLLLLALVGLAALPLRAQSLQPTTPADVRDARAVSLTVRSLLGLLREAVVHAPEPGLDNRLRLFTQSLVAFEPGETTPPDDLAVQLERLLEDVVRLRDDLRAEGAAVTAGRLDPIVEGLRSALATARDAEPTPTGFRFSWEHDGPAEADADEAWDDADEPWDDAAGSDDQTPDESHDVRHDAPGHHDKPRRANYLGARIGEEVFWERTVVQDDLPVRYNRVEGFYIGLERGPLELDSRRAARLFGEVGYAFGLEDIRYAAGLDLRVTPRGPYAAKVGGLYRQSTVTEDRWKIDPVENALGAFFARHEAYDYYEAEGWTVYGEMQLAQYGRAQAGFRSETHRALDRTRTWGVFGDAGDARFNPLASEGEVKALLGAVEWGRVRGLTSLPRGAALRLEAEVGQGVGGDYDFTRLVADGRLYLPLSSQGSLSLRLRGGTAYGDRVPFQKGFTVGGLGSARAYPQNAFGGRRMLAASAEVALANPDVLDDLFDELFGDLQLFGFSDFAWTGAGAFAVADGVGDVGLGLGLDERRVRLELAFPLRDEGFGLRPTLWLRVSPAF